MPASGPQIKRPSGTRHEVPAAVGTKATDLPSQWSLSDRCGQTARHPTLIASTSYLPFGQRTTAGRQAAAAAARTRGNERVLMVSQLPPLHEQSVGLEAFRPKYVCCWKGA